jgi:phosphonate transport system substrate-binding protein
MRAGKLEVLLVSPMSYYQAKRLAGVEPLVTTGASDAMPYKTVFITKSSRSDINRIEDLQGKTFAFVDPASSSGFMYPKTHLITRLGLDADLLEQPGYFFKTVMYSGKHDFSVIGVDMGDYEAAAVAYEIIFQMHDAGIINRDNIKIVGETEVIPNACYVIRPDLPQDLKDAILNYYLAYNDPEYFQTFYRNPDMRFVRAHDSDYAVVDEMVRVLKIEG